MDHLRQCAEACVLRACGFGGLAILCFLVGMSFDGLIMLRSGGMTTLIMASILYAKAFNAPRRNYRRTEMWLYLPKEHRPPEQFAQFVVGSVLRETYARAALWVAGTSIVFWSLSLVLSAGRYLGLVSAAPLW